MNDFRNTLHCCDNLELLKQLPDNYIDLIYCDILYGTGRDFGDYIDLKCNRKIIEEHYTPRLIEMHRVLKSTSSIYLQMDAKINHWIRCLIDKIFGYSNFRNEITYKRFNGVKNTKSTKFQVQSDRILFYTKSNIYTFNQQYNSLSESKLREYKNVDENGRLYCIQRGSKHKNYNDSNNNSKNNTVTYLDTINGSPVTDLWIDSVLGSSSSERLDYPTQKPIKLLNRIIKSSSNDSDLVADFYMGSGTTIVAASELNRYYIGCDINQRAFYLTKSRLQTKSVNQIVIPTKNTFFNFE